MNELVIKAQNGDMEAQTRLFNDSEWVIHTLARKYSLDNDGYEDLVSLGLVIFCETLKTFNSTKCKFTTQLWTKCRGKFINHSTRNQGYSVKVSTYLADLMAKLRKFEDEFFKREFRAPTDKECLEFLGVGENTLKDLKSVESAREKIYLDEISFKCSPEAPVETTAINKVVANQAMVESGLTERETKVIQALYFYELSVTEIAKILKVSRVTVYNNLNSALKKMRKRLRTV